MITDYREEFVPSVRTPNEIFVIDGLSVDVAAIVFVASSAGSLLNVKERLIGLALHRCRRSYSDFSTWLVLSNRVAQPDNRVTRHYGLWRSLKMRGFEIPAGLECIEHAVSTREELRFYGALRLPQGGLPCLAALLTEETGAVVISRNDRLPTHMSGLLTVGWRVDPLVTPSDELFTAAAQDDCLIASVYGQFDDYEAAAAVFGASEDIGKLTRKRKVCKT
ncbi:MAG: hypothetical protein JSR82_18300 [Verrucomicrobia bacterium]|nr:hypothetical protein [Verrucomicrobiota bacterium]